MAARRRCAIACRRERVAPHQQQFRQAQQVAADLDAARDVVAGGERGGVQGQLRQAAGHRGEQVVGDHLVATRVQALDLDADLLDTLGRAAFEHHELPAPRRRDDLVRHQGVTAGDVLELVHQLARAGQFGLVAVHRAGPDQGDAARHGVAMQARLGDRILGNLEGLRVVAGQPQGVGHAAQGADVVVEAELGRRIGQRARAVGDRALPMVLRACGFADEMERHAEQRIDDGDGLRAVQLGQQRLRPPRRGQRIAEASVSMQQHGVAVQQVHLAAAVAQRFRQCDAAPERGLGLIDVAAREHQRLAQRGLQPHLEGRGLQFGGQHAKRGAGPAQALGQLGQLQQQRTQRGRELHHFRGVGRIVQATLQRGAQVGQIRIQRVQRFPGQGLRRAPLRQRAEVIAEASRDDGQLLGASELPAAIRLGRVEQTVAQCRTAGVDVHERLRDQLGDQVDRVGGLDVERADVDGRIERERAGEDRQAAQQPPLGGAEQVEAPVERRAERLVARYRRAAPVPHQLHAGVEVRHDGLQAQRLDAAGGQFEGQGDAVELATQARHERCVVVPQFVASAARCRPLDEQAHRGVGERRARRHAFAFGRKGERKQSVDEFATGPQRLAAGREHMDGGAVQDEVLGHLRGGADHMFAAIQDEQQLAIDDVGGDRRQRGQVALESDGRRDGAADQAGVRGCRQVDEAHVLVEVARGVLRAGDRGGRLADAARPDDGHQAPLHEAVLDERQLAVAPDDGRGQRGQRSRPPRRLDAHVARDRLALDGGDERVALVRGVDDVARPLGAFAQRLAHGIHVESEVALVDDEVAPHPVDQLLLGDDAPRVIDQRDQEIQGAAAKPDRHAAAPQEPFLRGQLERAERGLPPGRCCGAGRVHEALRSSGSSVSTRARRTSRRTIVDACTVKWRSRIMGWAERGHSKFPRMPALSITTS